MLFGDIQPLHETALVANERADGALPRADDRRFVDDRERDGRDTRFELPCMVGEWRVALIRHVRSNTDFQAEFDASPYSLGDATHEVIGVMMWHAGIVGPAASDAALLLRAFEEDVSEGREQALAGVRSLDTYAWQPGPPATSRNDRAPRGHKLEPKHLNRVRRGWWCAFLPTHLYWSRMWPWLAADAAARSSKLDRAFQRAERAAAAKGEDVDYGTAHCELDCAPVGASTLGASGAAVATGVLSGKWSMPYAGGSVWMHKGAKDSQWRGCKAFAWFEERGSFVFDKSEWLIGRARVGWSGDEDDAFVPSASGSSDSDGSNSALESGELADLVGDAAKPAPKRSKNGGGSS